MALRGCSRRLLATLRAPNPSSTRTHTRLCMPVAAHALAPVQRRALANIPKYEWGVPTRLSPGDRCSMSKSFSEADVRAFGGASGDWNPVHYPEMYDRWKQQQQQQSADGATAAGVAAPSASTSTAAASATPASSSPASTSSPLPTGAPRFPAPIVHGMLSSSLIGTLFASHLPGAIYLSQSLHFRAPVFYDERVTAHIEVLSVERRNRVRCRTWVEKDNTAAGGAPILLVDGEATVMVESLTQQQQQPET